MLYKLLKSCQQRDTADSWFQQFAAAAEEQAEEVTQGQGQVQSQGKKGGKGQKVASPFGWDLSAATAATTTTAASRKRKAPQAPLDERTVLKARFASALHEMERSGLVACSTATSTAAGGATAVTIDRKIYTWI